MKVPKKLDLLCIGLVCSVGLAAGRAQAREQSEAEDRPGPASKTQPAATQSTQPTQPAPQTRPSQRPPRVEFKIVSQDGPLGSIVVELTPERTPTTVRNFLRYVDGGFYDGTIFHRALPDFVIQAGQYFSPTHKKTEGLHAPIRNESRRGLQNERGTIAMARTHDPHTAACQFYINVVDNKQLDYPKAGQYGYCAFGRVIAGLDVVDRIANVPTTVSAAARRRYERYLAEGLQVQQAEKSLPINPPIIESARQLEGDAYDEYTPPPPPTPVAQPATAEVTPPARVEPLPPVDPNELVEPPPPVDPNELVEPEDDLDQDAEEQPEDELEEQPEDDVEEQPEDDMEEQSEEEAGEQPSDDSSEPSQEPEEPVED